MDTNNCTPTFWSTGYLPNGAKVSFTVPISDPTNAYGEALAFTSKLLADGFLLNPPGMEEGEESETIVTVMRREKSDGTPIIDFYPEWGFGDDLPYGTYKYLHQYLDGESDIADFLKVSGFQSLDNIPLYEAQAPLKRSQANRNPKETAVPTPFKVVRKQGKERVGSDGKPYRPWELVRYEAIGTSAPKTAENAAKPPSDAITGAWNEATVKKLVADFDGQLTTEQLLTALGVTRFGEWTKGDKAAREAISAFQKTLALEF